MTEIKFINNIPCIVLDEVENFRHIKVEFSGIDFTTMQEINWLNNIENIHKELKDYFDRFK